MILLIEIPFIWPNHIHSCTFILNVAPDGYKVATNRKCISVSEMGGGWGWGGGGGGPFKCITVSIIFLHNDKSFDFRKPMHLETNKNS